MLSEHVPCFFFHSTCFMFVLLILVIPRSFYFSEYEILTGVPNYWAHSFLGGVTSVLGYDIGRWKRPTESERVKGSTASWHMIGLCNFPSGLMARAWEGCKELINALIFCSVQYMYCDQMFSSMTVVVLDLPAQVGHCSIAACDSSDSLTPRTEADSQSLTLSQSTIRGSTQY